MSGWARGGGLTVEGEGEGVAMGQKDVHAGGLRERWDTAGG